MTSRCSIAAKVIDVNIRFLMSSQHQSLRYQNNLVNIVISSRQTIPTMSLSNTVFDKLLPTKHHFKLKQQLVTAMNPIPPPPTHLIIFKSVSTDTLYAAMYIKTTLSKTQLTPSSLSMK